MSEDSYDYNAINVPEHLTDEAKYAYIRKRIVALGRPPVSVLLESQQETDIDFRVELFRIALRGSPRKFASAKLQSDAECYQLWQFVLENDSVRTIQAKLINEMFYHGINVYNADGVLFRFPRMYRHTLFSVFDLDHYADKTAIQRLFLDYLAGKSQSIQLNIYSQMSRNCSEIAFFASVVPKDPFESHTLVQMYKTFPVDCMSVSDIPDNVDILGIVRKRAAAIISEAQRLLSDIDSQDTQSKRQRVPEDTPEPVSASSESSLEQVSAPLSETSSS